MTLRENLNVFNVKPLEEREMKFRFTPKKRVNNVNSINSAKLPMGDEVIAIDSFQF